MQVERTDVQQQQHVRKVGYSLITQPWFQTINSVEDLWLLEGNILISRRKNLTLHSFFVFTVTFKTKGFLDLDGYKSAYCLENTGVNDDG